MYAQLESWESIHRKRCRVFQRYAEGLADWARESGAHLPINPETCEQSYHMFHIVLPSSDQQGKLIEHLRLRGIQAVFHYLPLHLSAMGKELRRPARPGPHHGIRSITT